MGLMYGTGPLGRHPAGRFNFEVPAPGRALYLEPTPKRIQALVADVAVADSGNAFLLHESGLQPVYYFPPDDVRADLLAPSDFRTTCPKKGEATHHSVRIGDRLVENAAWTYPDPLPEAPPALRGLFAFYWDRIDHWLEESEEVFGHARDPYHRIDLLASDRCVRISLDGQLLAETHSALALFESNLPPRWYVERADVVAELTPSQTTTHCPYKGRAGYYSLARPGGEDLVWCYEQPLPEVGRIAGRLCFYNERVDLELDGVPVERPESPWRR